MHVFTFTNRPGGITYEATNCYEVNRESSVPLRIRLEWKAYPFPKEHINTCRWRMKAFPIRHPSGEVTHEDDWFFTGKGTWDYNVASYDNPILISASLLLIPAETIFDEIQAFILSLNDIQHEDTRTDIQKLESAGFDRKTSFRKM